MFKRNEGVLDRIVRLGLAAVLLPTGLLLLGAPQGNVLGIIVTVVGTIGLLTGITGFCLLYVPFGFSTLDKERQLIDRCRSMAARCGFGGSTGWGGMCGPRRQSNGAAPDQQAKGVQV